MGLLIGLLMAGDNFGVGACASGAAVASAEEFSLAMTAILLCRETKCSDATKRKETTTDDRKGFAQRL